MLRLKFLDLDQTEIKGAAFVNGCKYFHARNGVNPPLQYLNIEKSSLKKANDDRKWNFEIEEMKEMGRYLSNLSYIEICT